MRYRVALEAEREIEAIHVYIAADSPDAGRRFITRCHETFQWLSEMPRAGRPWRGRSAATRAVRVWCIAGFPNYLVFYKPGRRSIRILHVLSGARDLDRMFR